MVLSSITQVRAKTNNTKWIADIKQLKIALNMYANDNKGRYPSVPPSCIGAATGTKCWPGFTYNSGGGSGINASPTLDAMISPYITIPVDPSPNRSVGDRYVYFSGSATIYYNGVDSQSGVWIAWQPEVPSPNSDSLCAGGKSACCSSIGCGTPDFFCVERID